MRDTALKDAALVSLQLSWPLDSARSWVRLFVNLFDSLIFALAVYLVVTNTFVDPGVERFSLILLGVIALRWTLTVVASTVESAPMLDRYAEATDRPIRFAACAAVVPSTAVFLVSFVLAFAFTNVFSPAAPSLLSVMQLVFVVAVQASVLALLWLAIVMSIRRRILTAILPVVVVILILAVLSPIAYQLGDLPQPANFLLTSLNPVTHLLAAYHNAWWFGNPISLKVLPVLLVICLAAAYGVARRLHIGLSEARQEVFPGRPGAAVFRDWGRLPVQRTGRETAALLLAAANGAAAAQHADTVLDRAGLGDLADEPLSSYSDANLALLALTLACSYGRPDIVLVGHYDLLQPTDRQRADAIVAAARATGTRIEIRPADGAEGRLDPPAG